MYSHMSRQKSMSTALKRTMAWNTSARASWDSIWVVSGFQVSPKLSTKRRDIPIQSTSG